MAGTRCKYCNSQYSEVRRTVEKDVTFQGKVIRITKRYRVCMNVHCRLPFTTVEYPEHEDQMDMPVIMPDQPKRQPPPLPLNKLRNPYVDEG